MSGVSATNSSPPLRGDLHSERIEASPRPYRLVIDEIGGRFTRVSEQAWRLLCHGGADASLWHQAQAAGWTRNRSATSRIPFSPLAIRFQWGSIDPIASRLAGCSGFLFSPAAVMAWMLLIAFAAALAVSRGSEIIASLGSLQQFLAQANPVRLAALFAITKVIHELAHAVMCRRMGSRCGGVGVLLLAGFPCPYCDVTDLWRQPSATRRAAVMLAGIYVELIIAAVATLVWVAAIDPIVRFHALNLMVVCGISTVVFNANPLLRYDGYYVLGDLLGSTNLREEARDAFRSVVTARLAGHTYPSSRIAGILQVGLSCFHVASSLYRCIVLAAIATLLIGVADFLHLRTLAVATVLGVIVLAIIRGARRLLAVSAGRGRWVDVPRWRRIGLPVASGIVILGILLVPFPRYRSVTGRVDAPRAVRVYLPADGMVERVAFEIGDVVRRGESLVRLRDQSLELEQTRLEGQLRLATMRSKLSRRVRLGSAATADDWKTFRAAEETAHVQLASMTRRLEALDVIAPRDGVILPAGVERLGESESGPRIPLRLRDRLGTLADPASAWCRISADGAVEAVFTIDARDRTTIDVGSTVRLCLIDSPRQLFSTQVRSVSAIAADQDAITREAAYQVLCPLPAVESSQMLAWLGKECRAVFRLPSRSIVSDLSQSFCEWLGGT